MADLPDVNAMVEADVKFWTGVAELSFRSVLAQLEHLAATGRPLDHLAEASGGIVASDGAGGLVLSDDVSDLVRIELVDLCAAGASPFKLLEILPSDGYLGLVSALTNDSDAHTVSVNHGWPVLSVAGGSATVAEGGRGGNTSPAGGLQ